MTARPQDPSRLESTGAGLARQPVVWLAFLSLGLVWFYLAALSRHDPWYRNTDMNVHNMVDALAINSGLSPANIDQPGLPSKYLLALDYRVRHFLGVLPVWNLKKLGGSADPLREIPALIRIERIHSRVLVILFILSAAGLTYVVTGNSEAAALTVVLLSGSSGLLFHGLLTRPELTCVWLGNVLALLCAWQATVVPRCTRRHGWLFLAGMSGALATLAKLPGLGYLVVCYAWCWLAPWTVESPTDAVAPASGKPRFWDGLWPALSGVAVLGLMFHLNERPNAPSSVAASRLRAAAVLIALLPLLAGARTRHRLGAFLLDRGRELALLGAGALAVLALSYPALRVVMPEAQASIYLAGMVDLIFDPIPHLRAIMTANPDITRELTLFFHETPFLFLGSIAVAGGLWWGRSIPRRLRVFILLLLLTALGMTLLMSRRYFFLPYTIFAQVPLLLIWSLAFHGVGGGRPRPPQGEDRQWVGPVAMAMALVILLTVPLSLQPKYETYQADAGLPVNEFTLTFLYDHNSHPVRYREIMAQHYGDRENFARALASYLADPANRY